MIYNQQYPLLEPLPKIKRHDQLPNGTKILGQVSKGNLPNAQKYTFVKQGNTGLSFISWNDQPSATYLDYVCYQYDFPLKVLSWFPKALEEFKKPPAQGGLHAGAMISQDEDVDGEMLAVGSTTRGYEITNWSRHAKGVDARPDYYQPTELSLPDELLYDYGLLDLWKDLGEKYERGEL